MLTSEQKNPPADGRCGMSDNQEFGVDLNRVFALSCGLENLLSMVAHSGLGIDSSGVSLIIEVLRQMQFSLADGELWRFEVVEKKKGAE